MICYFHHTFPVVSCCCCVCVCVGEEGLYINTHHSSSFRRGVCCVRWELSNGGKGRRGSRWIGGRMNNIMRIKVDRTPSPVRHRTAVFKGVLAKQTFTRTARAGRYCDWINMTPRRKWRRSESKPYFERMKAWKSSGCFFLIVLS